MSKLLLCALAVSALALPAAASAAPNPRQTVTISGAKIALQGRAFVKAELTAAAGAQPVRVLGRAGFMRFVDLGGDLKVRCQGRGEAQGHRNDKGQTVFLCAGAGGRAEATGSHFAIQGFALRYGLAIPDGYTGTVEGRLRERQAGAGAQQGAPSSTASSIDADLAAALAQG
jgi:hypothetical protein